MNSAVDFETRVIVVGNSMYHRQRTIHANSRMLFQLINIILTFAYDHTNMHISSYLSVSTKKRMFPFLWGDFRYFIRLTHETNALTRIHVILAMNYVQHDLIDIDSSLRTTLNMLCPL